MTNNNLYNEFINIISDEFTFKYLSNFINDNMNNIDFLCFVAPNEYSWIILNKGKLFQHYNYYGTNIYIAYLDLNKTNKNFGDIWHVITAERYYDENNILSFTDDYYTNNIIDYYVMKDSLNSYLVSFESIHTSIINIPKKNISKKIKYEEYDIL